MSHVTPLTLELPNHNNGAFSQISDDILRDIILYAMGGLTTTLPLCSKDPRWILSHVCRRWRALIVKNPNFWKIFRFLPASGDPILLREMTQTALERSEKRSIDLYFDSRSMPVEAMKARNQIKRAMKFVYGRGQINIVSRILLAFASQIRSIRWDIYTARFIKAFLFIPAGTFPLLETVDLAFVNGLPLNSRRTPFTAQELYKISVFADLPKLRCVTLHLTNGLSALALGLPLGHIMVLDLGNTAIPPDEFMEIICRSSPSLLEGFFHITFTATPEGCEPVPLYIRPACGWKIRRLRLILSEPGQDDRMFGLLTLPVLEELKVAYQDPANASGWKMSALSRMLKASSATLMTLSLRKDWPLVDHSQPNGIPKKKPLGRLCKKLPNLIALHLSPAFGLPKAALDEFSKGQLLPKLGFLKMNARNGSSVLRATIRRNELVLEQMNEPASSSSRNAVFYLDVLLLAVPHKHKSDIDAKCQDLGARTALRLTMVNILDEDA